MCGITGFVGFNDKNLLKRMSSVIKHRGPDEEGYFEDDNISLASRRLKIIDLKMGRQPIFNEDRSVCVVFNGEIYNYKELRKKLKNQHEFYTNTDTEVIVHLWEDFGLECFDLLEGMFAFALWDSRDYTLYLVRDRLGIKPLYYYYDNEKLLFASEIKAILQHEAIPRKVNKNALNWFMTYKYVPYQETFFSGINKMLPGEFLSLNIRPENFGRLNPERVLYYILYPGTGKNYSEMVKGSVKKRLMSDVPLGAFLSGGLDSSLLVSYMGENVKTFSAGFDVEDYDESPYARMVANHLNTDHTEVIVKQDDLKILPEVIYHSDEPITGGSAIPLYLLAKEAKKKVTVVLTGEGGDEVFGGYGGYNAMELVYKFRRTPNKLIPPIWKFKKLAKYKANTLAGIYAKYMAHVPETEKKKLLNFNVPTPLLQFEYGGDTPRKQLMYTELKTRVPEELLMKMDKITMAHGLEARVPYLDHNLVENVISLGDKFRKDKIILKMLAKNRIPDTIINRKKHGFDIPVYSWIKEVDDKLFYNREFFEDNYIKKALGNRKKYNETLWECLWFNVWYKMFIEGKDVKI